MNRRTYSRISQIIEWLKTGATEDEVNTIYEQMCASVADAAVEDAIKEQQWDR